MIGYVDGFIQGSLRGWLCNPKDPSAPQRIKVRDSQGHGLDFATHLYRPDVCKVLGVHGCFGFAIKREWLRGFGRTITLSHDEGAMPGQAVVQLPQLPAATSATTGPLNIFLHLAKTGGTSIRDALTCQISDAETLLIYPGQSIGVNEEKIRELPLHQRQRLRLVYGHTAFGLHDRLNVPSRYNIFIRDPVTRLRSNVAHHFIKDSTFRIGARLLETADIANRGLTEEFDNLMVRVVTGLSRDRVPLGQIDDLHVELALRNIRQHFDFVGLYEAMDKSFVQLCDEFGFRRMTLPSENVTSKTWAGFAEHMGSIDWPAVMKRNRYDVALYRAIQDSGLIGTLNESAETG